MRLTRKLSESWKLAPASWAAGRQFRGAFERLLPGLFFGLALAFFTPTGAQAQGYKVLYSFCALQNCADGDQPGQIVSDATGSLYGVTLYGGAGGEGTVFKLDTMGNETVLYNFCSVGGADCLDGSVPFALTVDSDDNIYGVTSEGGTSNGGVVFELDNSGNETVLYNFWGGVTTCPNGSLSSPQPTLVRDSSGNLYGVTLGTCVNNVGTVYMIDAGGQLTVLHTFCSDSSTDCPDGSSPNWGLVLDNSGNLFGTTAAGGVNNLGTIFEINSQGDESVLYSFCSAENCTDGAAPFGGLAADSTGNLYGTTVLGGTDGLNGYGVVFKLNTSEQESALYNFCGGSSCAIGPGIDAETSWGGSFALDTGGDLFGAYSTYASGGALGDGLMYEISNAGQATVVHDFGSFSGDGYTPRSGLIFDANYIYGTTSTGGAYGFGAVFTYGLLGSSPSPLSITTSSLPNGTGGTSYSQTLQASGGVAPYTWSVSSGTLPAGLLLAPSTGVISGTPTTVGTFSFTVQVEDAESTPESATANLSITVNAASPAALKITTSSLPSGSVGIAYSQTLQASGGITPYTWNISSGSLPAGLSLGASTGTISGTPTSASTSSFTVQVADSESTPQTASAMLSITISPAALAITTSSLPNGTVGTAYSQTLQATGGVTPYTWSVSSGNLPTGLSLASATGVISGTPTTAATSDFTVEVTDSESTPLTATASFGIIINNSVTPGFSLAANPSSLTIVAGQSGTTTITLTPTGGFTGTVSLACSGLPAYSTCSFSPTMLTAGSSGAAVTTTLTIETNVATAASLATPETRFRRQNLPSIYAATCLAGIALLFGLRRRIMAARRSGLGLILFTVLCVGSIALSGCGAGSSKSSGPKTPAGNSTVTVTATAGNVQNTFSLAVSVTQ